MSKAPGGRGRRETGGLKWYWIVIGVVALLIFLFWLFGGTVWLFRGPVDGTAAPVDTSEVRGFAGPTATS